MAKLVVGLGAYQYRFAVWPDKLDELSTVGVAPDVLVPCAGQPFGYRVEESIALLWGFEPSIGGLSNVPDDPPPLDCR